MDEETTQEFSALKAATTDVRTTSRRIAATLVRLESKVDDVAERMATKDGLKAIKSRLDDLTI